VTNRNPAARASSRFLAAASIRMAQNLLAKLDQIEARSEREPRLRRAG
jgi:hypothetical protein